MSREETPGEPAGAPAPAAISEELRRRRREGELLPSLERRLDEDFAGLTPGAEEGRFGAVLDLAERSSYVDIEVPVRSNLPAGGLAKRGLRKLMWWYLDYLTQQLSRFTWATTRLIRLVDERLSRLEEARGSASAVRGLVPPIDVGPWAELVVTSTAAAPGPVVNIDCADGALLAALTHRSPAAYGVDTRADLLDHAAARGLDVHLAEGLDHLEGLDGASLGGVIVGGSADALALGDRLRLVRLSEAKLRAGGVVVILGRSRAEWDRAVPPVVSDLSPGHPLHPETWAHLLAEGGFQQVEVHRGPGEATFAVVGVRGT